MSKSDVALLVVWAALLGMVLAKELSGEGSFIGNTIREVTHD